MRIIEIQGYGRVLDMSDRLRDASLCGLRSLFFVTCVAHIDVDLVCNGDDGGDKEAERVDGTNARYLYPCPHVPASPQVLATESARRVCPRLEANWGARVQKSRLAKGQEQSTFSSMQLTFDCPISPKLEGVLPKSHSPCGAIFAWPKKHDSCLPLVRRNGGKWHR